MREHRSRAARIRAMTRLQIGAIAGPTIALASVAVRSANLRVLGSGKGSVTTESIVMRASSGTVRRVATEHYKLGSKRSL